MRSILALLLLAAPAAGQTTWIVDVNGLPPGDGSTANPYTSIQFAIDRPSTIDGDTVLVLPGTYIETLNFVGKAIRVESRDGADVTTVNASGTGSVVTTWTMEGPDSVLDGFTLRGGTGSAMAIARGGGILCFGTAPTLRNLVITDNEAMLGGGVYVGAGADVTLEACTIIGNQAHLGQNAPYFGGGVYCDGLAGATLTLVDCLVAENTGSSGAGVFVYGVSATIQDTTIARNQAFPSNFGEAARGGGISALAGAVVEIIDSDIVDNIANGEGSAGGGVYCEPGASTSISGGRLEGNRADTGGGAHGATLADCLVRANTAEGPGVLADSARGGGLAHCSATRCQLDRNTAVATDATGASAGGGAADCLLERCTLQRNEADYGGAVWRSDLEHCALYRNQAMVAGGAASGFDATVTTFLNSILWDNAPGELALNGGALTVEYSDVSGGFAGPGNIDADPLFYGPAGGDLHLSAGSPCIDAGDPISTPDPDGSVADMGAFSFDPAYCGEPLAYCAAKVSSPGCLPAVGFTGAPTLSGPDDFVVTAAAIVNGKLGLMFIGRTADAAPFFGGTRCVGFPIARTPVQSSGGSAPPASDCSGTFAFAFDQSALSLQGLGTRVYTQYIYRDPAHPDGTGVGLTDGLEFTVCP